MWHTDATAVPSCDVYPTAASLSNESSFFHSADFQPLEFDMLGAYTPSNISFNCDTAASVLGCDECSIDRRDAAADNVMYNSAAATVAKAVPGDTTLSTTVEHYSSASAALNGDVTNDGVDDDDLIATVDLATRRHCDLTEPNPSRDCDLTVLTNTSLTDTNALFQQLLSSNALLDELDSDNSTFLQNCKYSSLAA